MTNADVIRQMTDDELYKFLQAIEIGDIDYSLTFCSLCKEDAQLDCDECFKRWLFGDADDYNGLLKDKGINSGYKTENSSEKPNKCETCTHYNPDHEAIACERCLGGKYSRYEPRKTNKAEKKQPTPILDFMVNGRVKTDPQTDNPCENCNREGKDICWDCAIKAKTEPQSNILLDAMAKAFGIEVEPQTERSE